VKNNGTIVNAVSSQDWSGDAAVYISIVNWIKGKYNFPKQLFYLDSGNRLQRKEMPSINSSLSLKTDVSGAKKLKCNRSPKKVFQGQTHGHIGFLVSKSEANVLLEKHPEYAEVLKPFLIGDEMISNLHSQPKRFVIDFTNQNLIEASQYKLLFQKIEQNVLPDIQKKAEDEKSGITKPNGREAQLKMW
jgi:hypothetical protein